MGPRYRGIYQRCGTVATKHVLFRSKKSPKNSVRSAGILHLQDALRLLEPELGLDLEEPGYQGQGAFEALEDAGRRHPELSNSCFLNVKLLVANERSEEETTAEFLFYKCGKKIYRARLRRMLYVLDKAGALGEDAWLAIERYESPEGERFFVSRKALLLSPPPSSSPPSSPSSSS